MVFHFTTHGFQHYLNFNISFSETCPGVCVAERLSGFCEAILDVEGVCNPDLKCCVSNQLFLGKPNPGLAKSTSSNIKSK